MDALFGVVNIPNVVWIDEDGMIVRPAEPGWAVPTELPERFLRTVRRPRDEVPRELTPEEQQARDERRAAAARQRAAINSGQDQATYADAIRDWVTKGADSEYALSPAEVVESSQPRPLDSSEAAAHFELANYLWRAGQRDVAIGHFKDCHRLAPDNWTYKRQAWSLVGNEQAGGERGRFQQGPTPGREDEWPFDSHFSADVAKLGPGEYYPKTM